MVGVPSSKGCTTCLRRAVKCDEARPACGQCRRGCRKCPGYVRAAKFVDEGPRLVRQKPQRQPLISSKQPKASALKMQYQPRAVKIEQNQLLTSFISTMFPLASSHSSYLGSWLWHIPSRFGRSEALDHAALSLGLIYFSQNGSTSLKHAAQQAYGIALHSLRTVLKNEEPIAAEPETLAATLLLGYYETISHVLHAWIRHTGGASRLLELRGASSCYSSAFEYSMYLASRGNIISEALHSGTSTFLVEPEWEAIPSDVIQFPLMPPPADGLSNEFFTLAARLARVLYHGSNCHINHNPLLLGETLAMKANFELWYAQYTKHENNLRRPIVSQQPLDTMEKTRNFATVTYHDTASATKITTYYAYLILLNRQIVKLNREDQQDLDISQQNENLAGSVCMSIPYCLEAGFCGISTLKMVLPIVQANIPEEYRKWLESTANDNRLF